jgi:hypothetical protein
VAVDDVAVEDRAVDRAHGDRVADTGDVDPTDVVRMSAGQLLSRA